MFKRKLEMRFVKDTGESPKTSLITNESVDTLTTMAKDVVKIVGVGVVLVIIAGVTANVIGDVVTHKLTQ